MTESDPAAFFESVYEAYQRAEQTVGGAIEKHYAIGAHTVCLRFAGPTLVPCITPALEHLAARPAVSPALTVCLWDRASTGTALPRPPWSLDAYDVRGEIRGYTNSHIRTAYYLGVNVLCLFDAQRDLAFYCTLDASREAHYQRSSPLLTILSWWSRTRGYQYLHAGAVGTSNGGVLLAGKGGSGKSTVAIACINSDLMYAGDDYCLLATDPSFHVYSLYNSGKLETSQMKKFPHLMSAISNFENLGVEKAIVFLQQSYPNKLLNGFPVRAVLTPRVTNRDETRLLPLSPSDALRALAPSTLFQLSGTGSSEFATIADFVRRVPCYVLELGNDFEKIPQEISNLLKDY